MGIGADGAGKSLGDHGTADHDLGRKPALAHQTHGVLHADHGGGHQRRKPDNGRADGFGLVDDPLGRYVLTEIDDLETVVAQHEADDILADIVDVAFHRGHDHLGLIRVGRFGKQRFQTGKAVAHGLGRDKQLGQEKFLALVALPHLHDGRDEFLV